jgi:hypothetical protein
MASNKLAITGLLLLAASSFTLAHAAADPSFITAAFASTEGQYYKTAVGAAIAHADRIVVSEHSSDVDSDQESISSYKPVTYREITMTPAQKAMFASNIGAMPPATQDAFPACIFNGHHTIKFYAGQKLTSTMEICFECGQIRWNGSQNNPPWALSSTLKAVIENLGLSPKRDWYALAKSRPATRAQSKMPQ